MDREALEGLGREDLVVEARRYGVKRPEVMTRVELVDEVLRLATPNPVERKKVRGWLGIARDLIASAVEMGLNLPDAAAMIRGDVRFEPLRPEQPPVATVTLAEIYGAQGHFDRAVGILDEVLEGEPDHEIAQRLRTRLAAERDGKAARQASSTKQSSEPSSLVPDEPEVRALEEEEEFDNRATLVPVKPPEVELSEAVDDTAVTLIPARPPETEFEEADSDLATLVPQKPDFPAQEEEIDLPTLPPRGPAPEPRPEGELDIDGERPTNPIPAGTSEASPEAEPERVPPGDPAVVLARTSSDSAQVYFELGSLTDLRGDPIVLRVVEHRPRMDGVERVERDLSVAAASGTTTILDLERGSFVRAALGRKWDGEFRAAAVAAEIRVEEGALGVAWAPRAGVNYEAVAHRGRLGKTPD